jgi:hypothetical protein
MQMGTERRRQRREDGGQSSIKVLDLETEADWTFEGHMNQVRALSGPWKDTIFETVRYELTFTADPNDGKKS